MTRIALYWVAVLAILFAHASAEIQRTVPIHDGKQHHAKFPSFHFWRKEMGADSYKPYLLNPNGKFEIARGFKERPQFDLQTAAVGIFWPITKYSGTTLEESQEVPSPDGRWAVKTRGIKTFADDLNNAHLFIRDLQKGEITKIRIPTNSMGTLWPLFWHPNSQTFYFMVMKGEVKSRTFGLWQYDVTRKAFQNIGTTDGRAFLSPDGEWIVWETGLLWDECDTSEIHHFIHLMAYHISEYINYRLTSGPTMNLFHGWAKDP